jgi:hypothetical protein
MNADKRGSEKGMEKPTRLFLIACSLAVLIRAYPRSSAAKGCFGSSFGQVIRGPHTRYPRRFRT